MIKGVLFCSSFCLFFKISVRLFVVIIRMVLFIRFFVYKRFRRLNFRIAACFKKLLAVEQLRTCRRNCDLGMFLMIAGG